MTAVVAPHTNFSMRQDSDKEVLDLEDLFNQYVETDLLQFNSDTADPSSCDDLDHLFELPPDEGTAGETLPLPNWDGLSSGDSSWHKALALEQNPASPLFQDESFSIYPQSHGKGSLSDPEVWKIDELFELDSLVPRRSFSNPSTPTPRTQASTKAIFQPERSERTLRHGIQKVAKRTSNFAKMMRPSHFRSGLQDIWSRKIDGPMDTFNLHLPSNAFPQSPPPSTKFSQGENSNEIFTQDQPYSIANSPRRSVGVRQTSSSNYQITPLSSPAMDTNSFQFSNDNFGGSFIHPPFSHENGALSALQTPPPTREIQTSAWGPISPAAANVDLSFSASPEFEVKSQGWYGVDCTENESSQNGVLTSTSQSHSQNGIVGFSSGGLNGLGITCDTASFFNSTADLPTPTQDHTTNGYINGISTGMSTFTPPVSNFDTPFVGDAMYTPTPHPTGIHIGNPLSNSRTPTSRSPSPPQMRFERRRHSSNHAQSHNATRAHRRKSSNTSTNGHNHHRSSTSSSSHTRSSSGGLGNFVNLTPNDSGKLLTGVAPSGSSKTKARREKEALEKRRKLSHAAKMAVKNAGGDVSMLDDTLLSALESA